MLEFQYMGEKWPIPEKSYTQELQETVQIKGVEGYIHVETNMQQMSESFGEFAEHFGQNRESAKQFFEQNVKVEFGDTDELPRDPQYYSDGTMEKTMRKMLSTKAAGEVILDGDNLRLGLNIKGISDGLSALKMGPMTGKGYEQMTTETRLMMLRELINTVTYHEFRHILQYMENPNRLKTILEKSSYNEKALFIAMTSSMAAAGAVVASGKTIEGVLAGTGILLTSVYGIKKYGDTKWGVDDIEKEPREAQKLVESLKLLKDPLSYTYESN